MKRVRYTCHDWSNQDFDWGGLSKAMDIIRTYATDIGRVGGQLKEKWGQIRFYAHFAGGWLNLHTIIYPGYVYCQFPKWLWNLDHNKYFRMLFIPFMKPFFLWQKYWYNKAYQMACKAYPHLKPEILFAADYPELIDGAQEYAEKFKRVYKEMYKRNVEDEGDDE